MKALLPVYCRPIGYGVIALALFLPFIFMMAGVINDSNLALSRQENAETEQIRNRATRNAMFLTVLFVFGGMVYRVARGDVFSVDTSSFLIFLLLNVLCLEFGIKKAAVDRLFKHHRR